VQETLRAFAPPAHAALYAWSVQRYYRQDQKPLHVFKDREMLSFFTPPRTAIL